MWTTYFHGPQKAWAEETGYADGMEFILHHLGALHYAEFVRPYKICNPHVEVVARDEGELSAREYRSPWGVLTELRKGPRLVQHRVRSPRDLRILIEMWKRDEVMTLPERFHQAQKIGHGRWPVVISAGPSPVQRLIQVDMSVEDFWYAMADYPHLMEEAFDVYQTTMRKIYEIITRFPADGFCEDENTSTTLISPTAYRRYSLPHIRQYAEAVHRAGKRLVVHMCGHLRGLVPIFPETGMDGIDCLTPPPVGDCEFRYAFEHMPARFFCTGRFGSSLWYGRSRKEILANLAACLPHDIYREHTFVLGVTGDGLRDISLSNIQLLRDCIAEYERRG